MSRLCMKVNSLISPILTPMATSLEPSEKGGGKISNLRSNTYHSGENWVKIGPVDPESRV